MTEVGNNNVPIFAKRRISRNSIFSREPEQIHRTLIFDDCLEPFENTVCSMLYLKIIPLDLTGSRITRSSAKASGYVNHDRKPTEITPH